MKKISIFLILASAIITFSKCSKNTDNLAKGHWNIYDKQHTVNFTQRADSLGYAVLAGNETQPTASAPDINCIYIWFPSGFPTKSGSYEMVDFQNQAISLTDGQIGISGTILPKDLRYPCTGVSFFAATGIESLLTDPWTVSAKAEVTLINGKIRVDIPETLARVDNCGLDSTSFNGAFIER